MKVRISKDRLIGDGEPCFIVAEMSANHNQDFNKAVEIVEAAARAGADAIKLQTYRSDTITFNSHDEHFQVPRNSVWSGRTLYELYEEAYTPWEWQPEIKRVAESLGMFCFSSPFDQTAVDFLDDMGVPLFKIASFELIDLPLIRYAAQKGKPLFMSTGMASFEEITEAVKEAESVDNTQIVLLKCVSSYPARPEEMNLRTIPHLKETFQCPVGLSDHTLGHEVALAALALGASVIEKHLTISRDSGGPDSTFSMEPDEFSFMVRAIRSIEKALGKISYAPTEGELTNRRLRRSLVVVKDMNQGEQFTPDNLKSLRCSGGVMPKYFRGLLGMAASRDICAGTPLAWEHVKDAKKDGHKSI